MNNNTLLLIIVILLVILFYFKQPTLKEGLLDSYQKYDYLKCCNKFGCNHQNCQNFIYKNQTPMYLIGVLVNINNNKKILDLYKQYNVKSKEYDFYYKYQSDDMNTFFILVAQNNLLDRDTVTIDDEKYTIYIYSDDIARSNNYHLLNNLTTYPQYMLFNPQYSNRIIMPQTEIVGYLEGLTNGDKLQLHELQVIPLRNIYRYFVLKNGSMLEVLEDGINVEGKLASGDVVNVLNKKYKVVITRASSIYYKSW